MRDAVFAPFLFIYRLAGGLAGGAVLGLAGLVCVAFLTPYAEDPLPLLMVAGGLVLVALISLSIGHRQLRLHARRALKATRDVMESVHRDALTGVSTRSYFMESLRQHVFPGSDRAVGYMQLDMDNLKVLNDGAGHGAGDAALAHLAQTIHAVVPGAIVGRLGGDEFGIAVLGCDNRGALLRLGEELLRRLDLPIIIAARTTRLSATIGLALAPVDACEVDDLVSKADLALYKGKKAGRRAVIAFDPDMLGDERHRRFIERELRAALLLDELELHYQPVFDTDMRVRSHEALLRWRHKVRGMIPPSQFIGIAEQSDLIEKLGEWVLRQACTDIGRLGTPVAVNVSPMQLRRVDFAARFSAILEEMAITPAQIIVEITETVPMGAGAIEQTNLIAIRKLGVRIAIDDFGAGHASLQYLRGFAFDIIKIDRSYVANIAESRIDAMIVSAICDIARSLSVDVVAEGVETERQLTLLREAGCTAFQGYLLGRPLALADRRAAAA